MIDIDKQVEELFTAGAHLGHKTARIHPKARKYIYKIENGVSIIDLTQTANQLNKALEFVSNLAKKKKNLLVIVTKKIAANFTLELCKKNGIPYITIKWPAGLLTNFATIMKNVKKMKTMQEEIKNGEWDKFVKHEQVQLRKDLNRLEKFYGGLSGLEKMPDALFVVDVKKEKNAVKEAHESNIPVVAAVDTNTDPNSVTYPIVVNDDSLSSIEYITNKIIEGYSQGKK